MASRSGGEAPDALNEAIDRAGVGSDEADKVEEYFVIAEQHRCAPDSWPAGAGSQPYEARKHGAEMLFQVLRAREEESRRRDRPQRGLCAAIVDRLTIGGDGPRALLYFGGTFQQVCRVRNDYQDEPLGCCW
ncbi:hypothetical protein [Streptomyces sp. URMC 129]|uniref:hypothetical protein n=1 Tax=Streptomyces sp. URMC 129 TaxID=3423407 RepID=UPI003F1E3DDF